MLFNTTTPIGEETERSLGVGINRIKESDTNCQASARVALHCTNTNIALSFGCNISHISSLLVVLNNTVLFGNSKSLPAKAVQSASLSLQSVHDVHGCNSLAARVLSVRHGVTDDVLEEHLQDTPGLLVDEATDALDTTSASQAADSRLGDSWKGDEERKRKKKAAAFLTRQCYRATLCDGAWHHPFRVPFLPLEKY